MRASRGKYLKFKDENVIKQKPVAESTLYPENPQLKAAPQSLTPEAQKLITINRLLINYWSLQSPFTVPLNDMLRTEHLDPETQMKKILEFAGLKYFPKELQEKTYVHCSTKKKLVCKIKAPTISSKTGDVEDASPKQDTESLEEEVEDFGGDDYLQCYGDDDADDLSEHSNDNPAF